MEISDGVHSSKIHVIRMSPLRHCSIGRRQDEYKKTGDDIKKSEVVFSNKSECYCISMIDIVGSTQITSKLYNSGKIKKWLLKESAFLARPTRFERVTPAFGGRYSIQLSYGRGWKAFLNRAHRITLFNSSVQPE